jgi:hypothetical protein
MITGKSLTKHLKHTQTYGQENNIKSAVSATVYEDSVLTRLTKRPGATGQGAPGGRLGRYDFNNARIHKPFI